MSSALPKSDAERIRGPGKRAGLSLAKIAEALERSAGIVSHAAESLGVNASTVRDWIGRHPELRQAVINGQYAVCDLAEGMLVRKVREGDMRAVLAGRDTRIRLLEERILELENDVRTQNILARANFLQMVELAGGDDELVRAIIRGHKAAAQLEKLDDEPS